MMSRPGQSMSAAPANQIAALLYTAWRPVPESPEFSVAALAEAVPLLKGTGAAALGWWRLRNSALRDEAVTLGLLDAYRYHAIRAAVRQKQIQETFQIFKSFQVEPMLVKGWAIAGLYPERGLRPYGDIDLCVRPADYQAALRAIGVCAERGLCVDLHNGFQEFGNAPVEAIFARS